jgi:hypothetical protein
MSYYYPFGETVHPLVQQDRTPNLRLREGVKAVKQMASLFIYVLKNEFFCHR